MSFLLGLYSQSAPTFLFRSQLSARTERDQSEVTRLEQEMVAETRAQETEVADITASYQRLEKVVVAHLQGLNKALQGDLNQQQQNQNQPTYLEQHMDDSMLSCSFNDENMFNSMRPSNVV